MLLLEKIFNFYDRMPTFHILQNIFFEANYPFNGIVEQVIGMKILIVVNTMDFFISHRLPIANQARTYGHDVHVATGTIVKSEEIERLGFTQHYVKMSRSGVNPFAALHTFCFFSNCSGLKGLTLCIWLQ